MAVLLVASVSYADKLFLIDTPTTNILNYGSYNVNFRAFGNGGIQTRLDFGVFKLLNVGVSWELDNFLGNEQVEAAVPALSVKFKLYQGNMTWPGIAIGYDGQGYYYNRDFDGDYIQRGKGLYVVLGRELFFEGLMVSLGANMNDFGDPRVYGFLSAIVPLYEESIYFMTEYDNINYFPEARLNAGLRFALTDAIDVDLIMRDCWGKDAYDKFPNERVFKISYTGKF